MVKAETAVPGDGLWGKKDILSSKYIFSLTYFANISWKSRCQWWNIAELMGERVQWWSSVEWEVRWQQYSSIDPGKQSKPWGILGCATLDQADETSSLLLGEQDTIDDEDN